MDSKKQLDKRNVILGLVIAPAVAPISFVFFLFIFVEIDQAFGIGGQVFGIGVRSIGIRGLALMALAYGFPLSYFVACAIVLPCVLCLQQTGRLKFVNFIAILVLSAFLFFFLSGVTVLEDPTFKHCCFRALYFLTITGPSTILSAICFWLISVRRHPRQCKKPETSVAI